MTQPVFSFQVIFSRESGARRRYQAGGRRLQAGGKADGDGFVSGIEMKTAVVPAQKLAHLFLADEFFPAQGGQEPVAEEFFQRLDAFHGHFVEPACGIDQPGSGQHVKMRMKYEVIAEALNPGNGSQFALGECEAKAKPVAQAGDGLAEEQGEQLAALAEDAAQRPGHGKDELAVGHVEAELVSDPVPGLFDLALVTGGAEPPGLAGEANAFRLPLYRPMRHGVCVSRIRSIRCPGASTGW